MHELSLYKTQITANDGTPVRLVYDQEADILEIFFAENEPATGIELTDHIILRFDRQTRRAVGLVLLHFSILTEHTEYGPRSYPLDKLEQIPEECREIVVRIMTAAPVNQFLKLSHFQASPTERRPFAYVELQPLMAVA